MAMATVLGLVPPFVGPIIYLFFRPPEYIEDVRERELEIRAMEERLVEARPALPGLPRGRRVDLPRLPGLHDPAEAGVREVQRPARGALADLPPLRDAGRRPRACPGSTTRSPTRGRPAQAGSGSTSNIRGPMAVERTLILIKPDATERALSGELLARIERRGFTVVGGKLLRVSEELGKEHYAEHSEKPFFGELVTFITSAPTWALVVEGEGAIATMRKTIGATNPADADPGTIRGDYATSMPNNLIHGSDSPESAEREISLWFADDELV